MSILSTIEKDGKKLLSILEVAARDADKGIVAIAKFIPQATKLADLLFPAYAPEINAGSSIAINVVDVIQNAIVEVEAKAKLIPAGLTGAQKSAEVLQIVSGVVIADLKSLGVTNPDTSFVQSIINAVVAFFNVPSVVA